MRTVNPASVRAKSILGVVVIAGFVGELCFVAAAQAASPRLEQAWRASIAHTPTPGKGCFKASYPLTVWRQVDCVAAPQRPYIPASGAGHWAGTTGDGNDYAAVTATLTASAIGSFPKVKGLKSETGAGGKPNYYSLQLNSNFMSNDNACSGAANPSSCLGWEQFVYSSSSKEAFMQYWLINYVSKCPSGWFTFSKDCYKNSAGVSVPLQVITELPNMSLSGTATSGTDTLVMTTKTQAYSTTGPDSVVFLANGWNASEFNVVGDGGGSAANFNAGTSLTVKIALTDGTTAKPACQANDGTTGETNNLDLGKCKMAGGAVPSVKFVESLPKR